MIDTMKITVMTPTLTPRIVSDERSLFERTVSMAIQADSFMSMKVIRSGHRDTEAQRKTKSTTGEAIVRFIYHRLCVSVPLWQLFCSESLYRIESGRPPRRP